MTFIKSLHKTFTRPFKRVKLFFKQKAGWLGEPKIIPFRGYCNEKEMFVSGRVVEDSGLTKPADKQKVWQNILATIKRFSSDEIAGVRVKAVFGGYTQIALTDEFGYFSFRFDTSEAIRSAGNSEWLTVNYELLDTIMENQPEVYATGEARVIYSGEQRIIVSDIDDTVLVSHSTQVLKKLHLMLFKNALTRLPFDGVSYFYQSLEKGHTGNEKHPFFFVSSSEWNLYDLLDDFFNHNQIPKGVFMLRKLTYPIYRFWKSGGGTHEHKFEKIKFLLEFYTRQKFVLIGDMGQRDPILYSRLALMFPGRIEAIYIRKVRSKNSDELAAYEEQLQEINTSYMVIEDSFGAMEHARNMGFL